MAALQSEGAQAGVSGEAGEPRPDTVADGARRIVLTDYEVAPDGAHGLRASVTVTWLGRRSVGEAPGKNLPKSRQRAIAEATLDAVTIAVASAHNGQRSGIALGLDQITTIQNDGPDYMVISVQARAGRVFKRLAGAVAVDPDAPDLAVVLAALQATDRWVRRASGLSVPV